MSSVSLQSIIVDYIDDFLDDLDPFKNIGEQIVSKLDEYIEKLRMEQEVLRTFVQFGNSNLDGLYSQLSLQIQKFDDLLQSFIYQNEDRDILAKYNMDHLASRLLDIFLAKYDIDHLSSRLLEDIIKIFVSSNNDCLAISAPMTEVQMFEYLDSLLNNLYVLREWCTKLILPSMNTYNILLVVCRHLRDFIELKIKGHILNKTTEYLSPKFLQHTADRVRQFCFDLWTKKYEDDADDSSKVTSLLLQIIPVELEVLYICSTRIEDSRSTEVEGFTKQLLEASPPILQIYLTLLQGRMSGALTVSASTRSINVMMEFLFIILTDISDHFIHRDKLNDMLAHTGVLTRELSILVRCLEESSSNEENMINGSSFPTPDLLQQIEQMKGDLRQTYLKAPDSCQLRFPMGDGLLFMNLLLRHLNDLFNSNSYSVALIKQEIGMVKEGLEFLRLSFSKVRQTLDDNALINNLWGRALDVAYEAEHVINSILVRDNGLSHFIFSLPSVIDKIKLIEAEVINLQLEDSAKNREPVDAKSSNDRIEASSSSIVEITVGFEEEAAWIIEQLIGGPTELDVISIVGMPGLGKTTLANKVSNDTSVAHHFDVHAWCTVSQQCNRSKVLQKILNDVSGSEDKTREDDTYDLADKLRRNLYRKRYLIVLDDLWDFTTWKELTACFPKVKRGNRIILTSRNSEVAWKVKCHTDPLYLPLLTLEESWELFEKKVFGEESCPYGLSDVGQEIVEKCQGLPLVVVLIAGVIRRKEKKKDLWLEILENLKYFVFEKEEQTMKVMQLSYDHLPDHLKPCLLYFAISEKNKRTPVTELIRLLMAEGFVDHIPSKSLEEATQTYLDALISSSLVMVSGSEAYVHDVVHEFCSIKASKGNFFMHRRLTIHNKYKCVLFDSKNKKSSGKQYVSLKVSGWLDPSSITHITTHLRLLRVLQLGDILLGDCSLNEIGLLVHLRFLQIQTDVKVLPWSWSNLQKLETLKVDSRYGPGMALMPTMWKLSKLRHVTIGSCYFFDEDVHAPTVLEENLKLEDLRTLSSVHISYSDVLERFPNLQHLECDFEALLDITKLDVLTKLQSLDASIYTWEVQPSREYHFPSSLKELRLFGFPPTPALLSAIVGLPVLKTLVIRSSHFEDEWDTRGDTFRNLQILSLTSVRFSGWQVDEETFPKLEQLMLEECEGLTEIPSAFGNISSLRYIHVADSHSSLRDSAYEIKDDVAAITGEDRLFVYTEDTSYRIGESLVGECF